MIRVLIVDDSPFVRLALKKILQSAGDMEVVGEASNGKEAVERARDLKPDVITLDINMPVMDGLTALEEIKRVHPEGKVLMVSALTKEGAKETIEALSRGAIDFITKPASYEDLFKFKDEIIAKIRAVSKASLRRSVVSEAPPPVRRDGFSKVPVIAIGISTGGPQTLSYVLSRLPGDFPAPILVAIHMPDTFTETFARHLDSMCRLPVGEAREGEVIRGGRVYISRGRIHMVVRGSPGRAHITYVNDDRYIYRPSADLLLSSTAKVFGSNTVGVVMTGMGNDGSKGIVEVKRAGGVTVAEDPRTAILWAMPENAVKTGCVDYVVPKERMADLFIKLVEKVRAQR
ncbi:MAG: chemotaxis response regulator protein-glutamate methylesterase [Aquificota bacterium]|nr:chemotaxis response regulator protein-glutamate methylesterase [Aquificota bacterium]